MPSWSEFWGPQSNSYSLLINKDPMRNQIKRQVNSEGFRVNTALFNSLIGAASGSGTGAITTRKVSAPAPGSATIDGGRRVIDSVSVINRTTTAADVTSLKEMTYNVSRRPTYPRDKSGNGGGAF